MIDLDRRRLRFVAPALLGWLLVFASVFLPWFVEPDGTGPNAFGLPAEILVGRLDRAFAGAGPVSIGDVLTGLAALGIVTLALRRLRLAGAVAALVALLCPLDYALQMLSSARFNTYVFQTFGPSLLMASVGALAAIAGAVLVELRSGR